MQGALLISLSVTGLIVFIFRTRFSCQMVWHIIARGDVRPVSLSHPTRQEFRRMRMTKFAYSQPGERGQDGLAVTSRVIVRPVLEELRLLVLPLLEHIDGRSPLQNGLRELAIVEPDVAQDRLFEALA